MKLSIKVLRKNIERMKSLNQNTLVRTKNDRQWQKIVQKYLDDVLALLDTQERELRGKQEALKETIENALKTKGPCSATLVYTAFLVSVEGMLGE